MIKTASIIRLENSKDGSLGILRFDTVIFCATLEPQNYFNLPDKSNIPCGQYSSMRIPYRGEETFIVVDVPVRSDILFHAGNVIDDTHGCILLGSHHDKLRGKRSVQNSGETFSKFMKALEGTDNFILTIKEEY